MKRPIQILTDLVRVGQTDPEGVDALATWRYRFNDWAIVTDGGYFLHCAIFLVLIFVFFQLWSDLAYIYGWVGLTETISIGKCS